MEIRPINPERAYVRPSVAHLVHGETDRRRLSGIELRLATLAAAPTTSASSLRHGSPSNSCNVRRRYGLRAMLPADSTRRDAAYRRTEVSDLWTDRCSTCSPLGAASGGASRDRTDDRSEERRVGKECRSWWWE